MIVNIASYPARGNPYNPYVDLFYDGLAPHGIELAGELKMDIDWLKEENSKLDAIHIHWPEGFWRKFIPTKSKIRQQLREKVPGIWRWFKLWDRFYYQDALKPFRQQLNKFQGVLYFYQFLKAAKQYHLRIIWTFHNAENHEGDDWIDRLGYWFLSRHVDLVIFHSEISKKVYVNRFKPPKDSAIMPHGNYDGIYPPARPREVILKELGLREDLPIISCLGMIRDYKGIDIACEAVKLLDGKVQFLCAGKPHPEFDIVELETQMKQISNALLIARFLSDQEFADYTSISDIVLLPYKKITGSGALLATLTLGRGVITSDLPYFREVLSDDYDAGCLTPTNNAKALAECIETYLQSPAKTRNQAARKLAEKYAWNEITHSVAQIIKTWKKYV